MAQIVKIHASKQPRRPHFIKEWAAKRRLSQADLARELDADKSIVSRWFAGATPGVEWQAKLAALFSVEPDSLFRHPDDDWLHALFLKRKALKELLVQRTEPELDRIRQVAETNRLLNIIANQLDATRQEVRTLNGSAWFIALALIVLCIATIFPKH